MNRLKWFEVGSIKFKRNESVILCPLSATKRRFGLLTDILCVNEKVVFVCKAFRTVKFFHHIQAFRLGIRSKEHDYFILQSPLELVDYHVYSLHSPGLYRPPNSFKDMFVVPRTEIIQYVL